MSEKMYVVITEDTALGEVIDIEVGEILSADSELDLVKRIVRYEASRPDHKCKLLPEGLEKRAFLKLYKEGKIEKKSI